MLTIKKFFFRSLLLFCSVILAVSGQKIFAQSNGQTGQMWYCDERLKLDLRVGTVVEIILYKKKKSEPLMAGFTKDKTKYKTESIVKFQTLDLDTGAQNPGTEEFYNVRAGSSPAVKFQVGQKYLFETTRFRVQPQNKSSEEYLFIQPKGFVKPYADAAADIDFLKSVKKLNKYQDVLGTDEGEIVSAGIISGKFTELVKPAYPRELKKAKVRESINVMILVAENGTVVKAKALCAKSPDLGASAEQAALASKFSPTVRNGKPIKIKGIIIYNFNP